MPVLKFCALGALGGQIPKSLFSNVTGVGGVSQSRCGAKEIDITHRRLRAPRTSAFPRGLAALYNLRMCITVYTVSDDLPLTDLFTLPMQRLDTDWNGAPAAVNMSFIVAVDRSSLYFGGSMQAPPNMSAAAPGAFYEGLWEYDVFELFWGRSDAESYQELNLAPRGAWWSMPFSSYRMRGTPSAHENFSVESFSDESGLWRAAIKLSLSALNEPLYPLEQLNANVTAITMKPGVRYFSYNHPPPSAEPDFHLAALRKPIERGWCA